MAHMSRTATNQRNYRPLGWQPVSFVNVYAGEIQISDHVAHQASPDSTRFLVFWPRKAIAEETLQILERGAAIFAPGVSRNFFAKIQSLCDNLTITFKIDRRSKPNDKDKHNS